MGAILYERIPAPTEFNPELTRAIDGWWRKAAARDRELRYQSAKELADALGDAIGSARLPVPDLVPRERLSSEPHLEPIVTPAPPRVSAGIEVPEPAPAVQRLADVAVLDDWEETDLPTGAPVSRTRVSVPHEARHWVMGIDVVSLVGLAVVLTLNPGARSDEPVALQPGNHPNVMTAARPLIAAVLDSPLRVTRNRSTPVVVPASPRASGASTFELGAAAKATSHQVRFEQAPQGLAAEDTPRPGLRDLGRMLARHVNPLEHTQARAPLHDVCSSRGSRRARLDGDRLPARTRATPRPAGSARSSRTDRDRVAHPGRSTER